MRLQLAINVSDLDEAVDFYQRLFDTEPAKMNTENPWSINATEGNLGPNVYKTGAYGNVLCSGLTTPLLQLGAGSQLTFSSRYAIENSWDKGEVQVSTDGGTAWTFVVHAG